MKRRFLLSAVALFALSVVATTNIARANCLAVRAAVRPVVARPRLAVKPPRLVRPACGCTEALCSEELPSVPLRAAEGPVWPAAARRAAAPRPAVQAPRLAARCAPAVPVRSGGLCPGLLCSPQVL